MDGRFLKTSYFQKSQFLFALISKDPKSRYNEGFVNSYLFADEIGESILDYYLICEFQRNHELDDELINRLVSIYETEDGNMVYIFSLEDHKEDVEYFLKGLYTKFKERSKNKIAAYYHVLSVDVGGNPIEKFPHAIKSPNSSPGSIYAYVIFRPKLFRDEIAKELVMNKELYDDIDDAIRIVDEMEEICLPYDKEKETFKKKIKK